jgi:hypothetical protein
LAGSKDAAVRPAPFFDHFYLSRTLKLKELIGRTVTRDCDKEQFILLTVERPLKAGLQPCWVIKGIHKERGLHKIEWDHFCNNYSIAN